MSKGNLNGKFYDLGQHIFCLYTLPSYSYRQDIFQKNIFLVLCECFCFKDGLHSKVCAPAFRYDVLLFQLFSLHSELFFYSQFESKLIVSVGWMLLNRLLHSGVKGLKADTFCFPDYLNNKAWATFVALLRLDILHIRTTYIMMLLNKTWEKYIDFYLLCFFFFKG